MARNTTLTRLAWRFGRKLYMHARGEERYGTVDRNGEAHAIRSMLTSTSDIEKLVVFDIGANQGDWTKNLLLATPEMRRIPARLALHAFEPVPATAKMYQAHIDALPGDKAVTLHEFAMSDAPGYAQIGVYEAGAGTNSLHFDRDTRPTETILKIALSSIDVFISEQDLDRVHYAKCDTEGHDAKVIKGAQKSLSRGAIDVLQFEYNHRWVLGRAFLKDIFDLIEPLPYNLAKINETGITLYEEWHPELDRFFQSNYVLVHDRALNWFDVHRGRFDGTNTYA